MDNLSLPLPTAPDDVSAWPTVCLVELWQPVGAGHNLALQSSRRLFAAPDWKTLWPVVDRCSLNSPRQRPVVITKYAGLGSHLPFLLQAVGMGLKLPRLYAVDGLITKPNLESYETAVPLPLLDCPVQILKQSLFDVRALWRRGGGADQLLGIGVVTLKGKQLLAAIPIPLAAKAVHRRLWQQEALGTHQLGSEAWQLFDALPVNDEAALAALVIDNAQPHYRLNAGILARLHLKAAKNSFAPSQAIGGITTERHHPHPYKLVIIQARLPPNGETPRPHAAPARPSAAGSAAVPSGAPA